MEREVVTIRENGKVSVPTNVKMRDFEIAELFGVMIPTLRSNIRAILKRGICEGDFTSGGSVAGKSIMPAYFGLDMVVALAFSLQSPPADIFRRWVLERVVLSNKAILHQVFISAEGHWDSQSIKLMN